MVSLLALLAISLGACGNLGLGEAECLSPTRGASGATILTVQAVPTAKYTPCIDELRLGWDSVTWFAESGRAGIEIQQDTDFSPFLSAIVTPSCDVGSAIPVASGIPDVQRFESVESTPVEIDITIVAAGEQGLWSSRLLAGEYADVEIEDRPVVITVDERIDQPASARVNLALSHDHYVWIVDELDASEGTVELRSNHPGAAGRGITPETALNLIEEAVPEVVYRGSWYFVFEGGCITYEFDAKGPLAETVADDAEQAIGFYPAAELRRGAEQAGYNLTS